MKKKIFEELKNKISKKEELLKKEFNSYNDIVETMLFYALPENVVEKLKKEGYDRLKIENYISEYANEIHITIYSSINDNDEKVVVFNDNGDVIDSSNFEDELFEEIAGDTVVESYEIINEGFVKIISLRPALYINLNTIYE